MTVLVDAPLLEPLRITAIPLPGVRARCGERGLHEGDHASCTRRSPNYLLLETASGLDVLLDRRDAAVIEVERLDGTTRYERAREGIASDAARRRSAADAREVRSRRAVNGRASC